MATMKISLPQPTHDWILAQVEEGRYSSASDYIRRLIHSDQQQALQAAITKGIQSGLDKAFDIETIQQELDGPE